MKKLSVWLLTLILLLTLAAPVSAAEGGTCGEGLAWVLEGSTLVIEGSGPMYDFTAGAPWDPYKDSITAVKMTGVSYVGAGAFKNYDGLTSVSFGSALYELGSESFYDCDGLTSLTMPASFKIFGASSLRSCDNLKEIRCSGAFPSFRDNCLWETSLTIVYDVNNPWKTQYVHDLESAFGGRIQFRGSDGSDPHGDPEPTEKPTEKPTPPPTQPPVIETTASTTGATEPDYTLQTEVQTVPRQPIPTAPAPVPQEESPMGGLAVALLVVGVLALVAAGGLLLWQRGQKKKRARRRSARRPGGPRQ